jgi:Protein of unknown function (DUF3037)
MSRYIYSLIRCVPDPRTGEFVNVGAIAGDPSTGDWSVRQVSSENRVRKLASPAALQAVHGFLARVGDQIDSLQSGTFEGVGDLLEENWLDNLYHDYQNVVQLSAPAPILAEDAEQALEILFSRQIIDPVSQAREGSLTKHRALYDIRRAYRRAALDPHLVRQRVELHVGDRVHTTLDFAVGNGTTLQLTQGWSFQGTLVSAVSEQVKAWAYALKCLRDGLESRVVAVDDHVSGVAKDVELEVVVIRPRTQQQNLVYEEALQVFTQIEASVHDLEDVDSVGRRAAELVGNFGQSGFLPMA